MDRARPLPEARLPWRSPKARRPPTERFLIYTLQRHEHVQRGVGPSVPRPRWSSAHLATRDRTDAAIAKPETPFVRQRRGRSTSRSGLPELDRADLKFRNLLAGCQQCRLAAATVSDPLRGEQPTADRAVS